MPNFTLGQTKISAEEFKAATEVSGSKQFEPGSYTLKLSNTTYHVNKVTGQITSNDPTWVNVVTTLVGNDGREKKHFILVPTQSIFYKGPSGKETAFLFTKLQEFMAGFGTYLDFQNYAKLIPEYFGSQAQLDRLNGLEVTVDIGYTKPYARFVEKDKYALSINGKDYAENDEVKYFPDRDSVKAFAATVLQKPVQSFPEITKVHAGKEQKQAEVKTATKW